ncbi:probable interferon-related developmental regulator 1 [Coccomyxa sp. Obi]|nr:probable interferon-related developmental regulator 1 [Coccomyxa sp. Obi]
MAKKKGGRRKERDESGDERLDSGSCASSSTLASLRDLESNDLQLVEEGDPFDRCIDALYEKRATTRERALEALIGLLSMHYNYDCAVERQGVLSSLAIRSVRYGGAVEAALASRALGLLSLTLGAGDDSERLLEEAKPVLERASTAGKGAQLKAMAVEALSVVAFVGVEDPGVLDSVMAHMTGLWKGVPAVAAAALRGWTLLLSTLPAQRLTAAFVESSLEALAQQLYSEATDVRAAAGEAIALLYDASGLVELEGDSGEESGQATPLEPGGKRSPGMEEVVARMKDLATNRGDALRRSKKSRASLRSTFREICSSVEGGNVAESRIKLRCGDVLVVNTPRVATQLAALRRFLAEGFQTHLQFNTLLHQVFDFEPLQERERLTAVERRLFRSPGSAVSKWRTQDRNSARAATAAYKGAMMAGFEE